MYRGPSQGPSAHVVGSGEVYCLVVFNTASLLHGTKLNWLYGMFVLLKINEARD